MKEVDVAAEIVDGPETLKNLRGLLNWRRNVPPQIVFSLGDQLMGLPTPVSRMLASVAVFLIVALGLLVPNIWAADAGVSKVAAAADQLLAEEIVVDEAAEAADDETFLRRLSLDLVGDQPTPQEITAFALDTSPDKRDRAINRLLDRPQFGQNWARYWRDVILARRSDDRALFLAGNSVTVFLTEQFNKSAGWDNIAEAFVTATGDVRQDGRTALIMAQEGKAAETAAEVSRIFLGIQIQCAQCHDHPYDNWSREQFHELAAFFPRTVVRPKLNSTTRTFEVTSFDRSVGRRPRNENASLEHYMPNLEDPSAKGKLMEPVFFATGEKLDTGNSDLKRRETLAAWMTGPENPWFAKAYVNRIWSELVGRGFYEPVDDMGPERKCLAPGALDYLAAEFANADYDVKWLFQVITSTDAYQRKSRSRSEAAKSPLTSNCPQPLRADQLYNVLTSALGITERASSLTYSGGPRARTDNIRTQFNLNFGYDPSLSRDDVAASIPQVLVMMNSPQLANAINGRSPRTMLGKLLADEKDNELVATELYLRCLGRQPSDQELKTCLGYVGTTGDRVEAFEDILWSLINSAEFRNRK